jgi:acyl-CoA thioester hydrolase
MSRTKLNFPNTITLFTTSIPIQITDINYGNHLGNDKLLGIIHEARVRFLQHFDMSELDVGGTSLIMGESIVIYKNESFYGDVLTVKIWADDISTAAFDLLYEVSTIREGKSIVVAQSKTVMICFDYTVRKTRAIPQKLLNVIQQ